jgi:hypothetical protein
MGVKLSNSMEAKASEGWIKLSDVMGAELSEVWGLS